MAYLYLKKSSLSKKKSKLNLKRKSSKKHLAALTLFLGLILLISAVYPILSFSIKYSSKFSQILSPLSTTFYNQKTILGQSNTDYTHLSNWFVEKDTFVNNDTSSPDTPTSYTLSIPKLKIKDANVAIGGEDLKKSLVQYQNTAFPGQLGNTVVFGHSVLPQFFNPKSYLTIFSTLYKLKQGDEIFVDYDNINYKYVVEQIFEVKPSDLTVLEQRFDGRFLSIITCSPPGTYLRRLVVKAKIVDI